MSFKPESRIFNSSIFINTTFFNKTTPGLPERSRKWQDNAYYKTFNIMNPPKREFLNVILIVSSAPSRIDRRTAIRETWWGSCRNSEKVRKVTFN